MGAAGTRERIIAANRYNPSDQLIAWRDTRTDKRSRVVQTHKQVGDLIITERRTVEVTQDGWN